MTEQTELQALITQLTERISALESQVASLQASREIPEEEMVAIGAAVSAFLGYQAKIKAVRFSSRRSWTGESMRSLHNRSVPMSR